MDQDLRDAFDSLGGQVSDLRRDLKNDIGKLGDQVETLDERLGDVEHHVFGSDPPAPGRLNGSGGGRRMYPSVPDIARQQEGQSNELDDLRREVQDLRGEVAETKGHTLRVAGDVARQSRRMGMIPAVEAAPDAEGKPTAAVASSWKQFSAFVFSESGASWFVRMLTLVLMILTAATYLRAGVPLPLPSERGAFPAPAAVQRAP